MEPDSAILLSFHDDEVIACLRTACPVMRACVALVEHAAPANVPVMLEGETGAGKSLLAGYLHRCSTQSGRPIVVMPCEELRENSVRRRLLGGKNGEGRGGIVARAAGGTLVFDGVERMDNAAQHELLGVLSEFSRTGGENGTTGFASRLGVRLVSIRGTSEQDASGVFLDELAYGLGEVIVRVPPLRERRDDMDSLVRLGLKLANAASGRHVSELSSSVRQFFLHYDFPGNVRELFSILDEAVASASGPKIYLEDFGDGDGGGDILPTEAVTPLAELERRQIYKALLRTGWKRNAAARLLGITETMLNRKISLYYLERR